MPPSKPPPSALPWIEKARLKRASVLNSIPKEWRLDPIPPPSQVPNVCSYLDSILPPHENEIARMPAHKLASEIAQGTYSALQVTTIFCHRAALAHQLTNCCSEIFFDAALDRARALDSYYQQNDNQVLGPLHGVPISLKDQFNVQGSSSAVGFVYAVDSPVKSPDQESLIVQILRDAGAIFYVKGTVPMGMMSAETFSNIYGQTLNSINRNLASGGSTGGDAVLLASNAAPLSVGTDIGGSLRIPSAMHGLRALKPSTSRFPYFQVENTMPDQPVMPSVIGPIAKSIDDLDLFAKIVLDANPWNHDAKVPPIPWKDTANVLTPPPPKIKSQFQNSQYIPPPKKYFTFAMEKWDGMYMPHPPIIRAQKLLRQALEKAGHQVIEWDFPDLPQIVATAHEIYQADDHKDIRDRAAKSGEPVIPQIVRPEEALNPPKVKSVTDHWEHARKKYHWQQQVLKYWNSTITKTRTGEPVDAWISPIWSTTSWIPGDMDKVPGSYAMVQNVLDLPAVTFPVTTVDKSIDKPLASGEYKPVSERDKVLQEYYDPELYHGMPVVLELVTRRYQEEQAIALTRVVEAALSSYQSTQ